MSPQIYRPSRQVRRNEPDYPAILVAAAGDAAPVELWLRGCLPEQPMVAIVPVQLAQSGSQARPQLEATHAATE